MKWKIRGYDIVRCLKIEIFVDLRLIGANGEKMFGRQRVFGVKHRWAQLPERGTPAALRTIRWVGMRVGRRAGRVLLYPIAFYFLLTATFARRSSRRYLRRVFGFDAGWRGVFRHIHCFSATILDRIYLLAGQFERFDIRLYNGELIAAQVAAQRGCILLGSHLGSFEVLRVLGVTLKRFPVKVLMDVEHNRSITDFLDALNPDIAGTVIPLGAPENLLKVKESLDQGYLIGTLGDRVALSDKVVRCRFLGAETDFPAGPLLMAAIMRCPVILFFGLYRGGNRYDIHFELLAEEVTMRREQRQEDIRCWTQRYVERLEYYTRQAPYNWFNFYDFWGEESAGS